MSGLRERVRAVLDGSSLSDPREIAEKIVGELGPAEARALLVEVLPGAVRVAMNHERSAAGEPVLASVPSVSDVVTEPEPVVRRGPSRSSKVAAVRDEWARRLACRECVGGVWKPLADCTRDDVATIAAQLRVQAGQLESKADWYERLAAAIPDGGTARDVATDPMGAAA